MMPAYWSEIVAGKAPPMRGSWMEGGCMGWVGFRTAVAGCHGQRHAFNSRLLFTRLAAAATTSAAFGMQLKMVH